MPASGCVADQRPNEGPDTTLRSRALKSWKRTTTAVLIAATIVLVAAACGSDDNSSSSSGATTTTVAGANIDYKSLTGTLNGSGSSFQDAFQQKAKTEFKTTAPNVTVNYTKSGSTAGKQDLANQVVQFAGTDSTIKPETLSTFKGGTVLYFPIVGAPITVSYNLKGVDKLQLSGETLAGIFSAQIKTWNDPKIKADNPDATLPSTPIAVVHRSEGSGTTSNFTRFLTKAAPTVWTLGSGDTVAWPASTQGAQANSGVASLIKSTDGAIGYVDLADAALADLTYASIKNSSEKYVAPTIAGAEAAMAGATINPDLTYDPINAPGADAYPITSPTWMILYQKQPSQQVADGLKGYVNFILTQGQGFAQSVGYAKLPSDLDKQAIAQLDKITT
jgi:phosphate transport system substrate-binding protein